uniref:Uncharacterized protein n=1 Tax=Arundo donax TaxID=35708 RepID=A0A0A9DW38_ARUDO
MFFSWKCNISEAMDENVEDYNNAISKRDNRSRLTLP